MQPLIFYAILFATSAFPSTTKTSWMTPQSFQLTIGMPRTEAVLTLQKSGWTVKDGKNDNEIVVDYTGEKALTLEFQKERLHAIRFELFGLIPDIRAAFVEQKSLLLKQHGDPKKNVRSQSIIVYDDRLPNILVVLNDDLKSEYGKKGVGYLAVRYYDPR
jgi:hypothetical protein